jgi:RNA polymerase sigma factor (sigma-70 family)
LDLSSAWEGELVLASDRILIDGCIAGDRRSWERLIRKYERLIYSVAIRCGLSAEDAADVFMTVCASLLENLSKLRDDDHLSGWLILSARRESWRLSRNAGKLVSLESAEAAMLCSDPDSSAGEPLDIVIRMEEHQIVREAMRRLGASCRYLLELRYLENPPISYVEIAARLDVSVGAVGPMRARCLEKMRDLLQKSGF